MSVKMYEKKRQNMNIKKWAAGNAGSLLRSLLFAADRAEHPFNRSDRMFNVFIRVGG